MENHQGEGGFFQLPLCDDPVFRAWVYACGLRPGERVRSSDPRVAELHQRMQRYGDLSYDPYQDPLDDPFPEERLPY
jgi:hypothetical protein